MLAFEVLFDFFCYSFYMLQVLHELLRLDSNEQSFTSTLRLHFRVMFSGLSSFPSTIFRMCLLGPLKKVGELLGGANAASGPSTVDLSGNLKRLFLSTVLVSSYQWFEWKTDILLLVLFCYEFGRLELCDEVWDR